MRRALSAPTSFCTTAQGSALMRAGSLNTKKSAPNRVCCNALLAAYARASPPQWRKASRLLDVMWLFGGELCPGECACWFVSTRFRIVCTRCYAVRCFTFTDRCTGLMEAHAFTIHSFVNVLRLIVRIGLSI